MFYEPGVKLEHGLRRFLEIKGKEQCQTVEEAQTELKATSQKQDFKSDLKLLMVWQDLVLSDRQEKGPLFPYYPIPLLSELSVDSYLIWNWGSQILYYFAILLHCVFENPIDY